MPLWLPASWHPNRILVQNSDFCLWLAKAENSHIAGAEEEVAPHPCWWVLIPSVPILTGWSYDRSYCPNWCNHQNREAWCMRSKASSIFEQRCDGVGDDTAQMARKHYEKAHMAQFYGKQAIDAGHAPHTPQQLVATAERWLDPVS